MIKFFILHHEPLSMFVMRLKRFTFLSIKVVITFLTTGYSASLSPFIAMRNFGLVVLEKMTQSASSLFSESHGMPGCFTSFRSSGAMFRNCFKFPNGTPMLDKSEND